MKLKIPTQTPINTKANSRTARAADTSSLVRQIQKAGRKYALGRICAQLDENLHRSHKGLDCFKPVPINRNVLCFTDVIGTISNEVRGEETTVSYI